MEQNQGIRHGTEGCHRDRGQPNGEVSFTSVEQPGYGQRPQYGRSEFEEYVDLVKGDAARVKPDKKPAGRAEG